MWTALATMSESELLRHSFRYRGGGAAEPRHFLRTLLLHDTSVASSECKVKSAFLTLSGGGVIEARCDEAIISATKRECNARTDEDDDDFQRPTPPLLNECRIAAVIESLFLAGGISRTRFDLEDKADRPLKDKLSERGDAHAMPRGPDEM